MKIVETYNNKNVYEGYLKCINDTTNEVLFEDHNQIVVDSGLILREFLANNVDARGITKMVFGDMNMDPAKNVRDVIPTTYNDWKLINPIHEVDVKVDKMEDDFGYGVTFTGVIEKDEMNGSNGEQLITEYGLFSGMYHSDNVEKDGHRIMFSRKTRSGIFKDFEMKLKFIWTIYFVKNISE